MMSYALSIAEKGLLWTSPNPMVGAIIVVNGKIIAEGYHEKYGEAHAEINAFNNLQNIPADAVLFVTLEPCSIHGKTPPCTNAILDVGIKNIYAAMEDPNPKISGSGFDILRKAGINVTVGIMEDKAKKLNERYIKYISTGVPWVTLKVAQTLDGRIADINGSSKWITSEASRKEVHKLRASHDAVLVGAGTVIKDNPSLDVRHVNGKQPVKIIIDQHLDSDVVSKVSCRLSVAPCLFRQSIVPSRSCFDIIELNLLTTMANFNPLAESSPSFRLYILTLSYPFNIKCPSLSLFVSRYFLFSA